MAVIAVGVFLGWWRGSDQLVEVRRLHAYAKQKVVIEAVAKTDAVYSDKTQLAFEAGDVRLLSPDQRPLIGTFKISGFGEPMVFRGELVRVQGKLYPTRGGKQASISYAQIERLAESRDWLAKVRRTFAAGMQTALPEPAASLGMGLLVGQRSTLPPDVLATLTTVGLVHIVAVSGYNVTILSRAVQRLNVTRSKYQKLVLALTLISVFVLITGFSASVVRAATVSLLSLLAWYYGRDIRPLVLIAFVAALTGLFNPLYVWSDIGWYLSFLAFFGVLVVAPLVGRRLFAQPDKRPLPMLAVESFAAQLMTLPLIMMIFERASIVSLLANVLVVPLVPVAMLLGAVAGVAGVLAPAMAGWAAWPAAIVLSYILDVAGLMSRLPFANLNVGLNSVNMLVVYAAIGALLLALRRKIILGLEGGQQKTTPAGGAKA